MFDCSDIKKPKEISPLKIWVKSLNIKIYES